MQKVTFVYFLAALLLVARMAGATDLYQGPLQALTVTKPNVVFGMDDSGSMDFELILRTNDGALWWNDSQRSGWDAKGAPLYNATGNSGGDWVKMAYLFPNECGPAMRRLCDSSGHHAIAPTTQFAFLRSSDYNPLYYDPSVLYEPWVTAVVGGTSKTFGPANPMAALSHPLYTASTNLTANISSTATDTTFMMRPGMVVPAGASLYISNKWQTQASPLTVPAGISYRAAITYYPATYWVKQACGVDGVTCTLAPDGESLKRYEIKSGNTFPSGRSYAAELQNFANWYTYYRKRKLMLGASMGSVLTNLSGMRLGLVAMNSRSAPTMYDTESTNPAANAQAVIGRFYQNTASGGTPTRQLLSYIGGQFTSNTAIVQSSCQRNAAFIVTDGFAENTVVTPPSYNASTWGQGAPYQTTYAGTLSDIALSYYTNNLRPDLPTGQVPTVAPTASNPGADNNPNLHLNTYAITLGAEGTLWPDFGNPYVGTLNWPNPVDNRSPTAVDDLWHATINSRGSMFSAKNPAQTAKAAQDALTQILKLAGSQGGVAFSTVNLKAGNALAYVGSYRPQTWSGDIAAYAVDTSTGALAPSPTWSADALLQARDYRTRAMATFNGTAGVELTAGQAGSLLNPGGAYGVAADLVKYVRGDRSAEGSTFRKRTGLLGAVVNAEPVSLSSEQVVFATSNEGMVHALDQETGRELWAYMPSFALSGAGAASQKTWTFQTLLDATPTLGKVAGRYLLVGGRGTAGTGFYALDVSHPRGSRTSPTETITDAVVAERVLWEFPNQSTPTAVVSTLGVSMGKPLIVNTHKYGTVVILTSGYNTSADGKGRLYVLEALTGQLLHTFVGSVGTAGSADAGLAQLSGFTEADGYVNYLYGGDLLGNLWRFSLEDGSVLHMAMLADSAGNAQPVTSAPELATVNGRRMVFVGTGRMLGQSDLADNSRQSFYALWDNNTAQGNPRANLAPRAITLSGTQRNVSGSAIDWTKQTGWYVDLPAGEKANTDPSIAFGVIAFTTNAPSNVSCASSSALYVADLASGLQLPDSAFTSGAPFFGLQLGSTLSGRVAISRLPAGGIVVTTHQSDNSTTSRQLTPVPARKPVKTGWKAVYR